MIAVSTLAGLHILDFFGISMASFQVVVGMLLLTSSLSMLNAQPTEAKSNVEEMHDVAEMSAMRTSIAVLPPTIPLLTGQGKFLPVMNISSFREIMKR